MSDVTPRNIDQVVDKQKFDENWDAIDWNDEHAGFLLAQEMLNVMYADKTLEDIKHATLPEWIAAQDGERAEISEEVWREMIKRIEEAGGGKIDLIYARPIDIVEINQAIKRGKRGKRGKT